MLTMPPEGHVETEEGALPTLVMLNIVSTRLLPDFILLTCSISVVNMYFQSERKLLACIFNQSGSCEHVFSIRVAVGSMYFRSEWQLLACFFNQSGSC